MTGFRIGTFTVRPRQEHIDGPNGAIHLEPKVMQVLEALAHLALDQSLAIATLWMNQNEKSG